MSNINPSIFKAYDIRGVYPDEINEDAAYKIGQAFVKFLENEGKIGNRQIIVGRDARESSPNLFEALTQGLLSQGVDVIDIGEVSTPLFYWALIKEGVAGLVHNSTFASETKLREKLELGKNYNFQITLFEPKDQKMTLVNLE